MKPKKYILFILLFTMIVQFNSCSDDAEDTLCNQMEYDGSFLTIDELSFCPAYLSVDKIQNYNRGYLEQKLISNFTTFHESEVVTDRLLDVQIVIRTPYPNPDNTELPVEFEGTYAELKNQGYHLSVFIEEETLKPTIYNVNIDSLPDQLKVYFKLDNFDEFIGINLRGNVILGEDMKKVAWESEFRQMN